MLWFSQYIQFSKTKQDTTHHFHKTSGSEINFYNSELPKFEKWQLQDSEKNYVNRLYTTYSSVLVNTVA